MSISWRIPSVIFILAVIPQNKFSLANRFQKSLGVCKKKKASFIGFRISTGQDHLKKSSWSFARA